MNKVDWKKEFFDLAKSVRNLRECKLEDVRYRLQAMDTVMDTAERMELQERGVRRLWRLGGDYLATIIYMEESGSEESHRMFYRGQLFDFGMQRANTNFSLYLHPDAYDGGCALIPRAMLEMIEVSIEDKSINWAGILS